MKINNQIFFTSFINKVSLWVIIVFVSILNFVYSQTLPGDVSNEVNRMFPVPIHKAPNVSGIEKYGQYGVNLFTGTPDISIPIYTVESGPIKVPILLTYNATGFKYKDQSTWVGMGWNLIAGGQISRSIQGKADESEFLNSSNTKPNNYTLSSDNCEEWDYKETAGNGRDTQADLFTYIFPGKRGSFYLRQQGMTPFLFPEAPIKLERSNLDSFEITDEDGIKYVFGKNSSGINYKDHTSVSGIGGATSSGVSSWHLVEIISPNSNDKVEITYQLLGTQNIQDTENNITVIDECNSTSVSLPCRSQVYGMLTSTVSSTTTQYGIKEIIYKTGKVEFVLGGKREDLSSLNRLKEIKIYSRIGDSFELVKSFELDNTTYFKNHTNASTSKVRMKLSQFFEKDRGGKVVKKHTFDYQTDNFSWTAHPNGYSRDLFGFYNAKGNSSLLAPTTIQMQPTTATAISNLTIGDANRSTDTTFYKEGVLKRINFPTGGYTEFQFEPHKYQDGGTTKYGGGLRIKRIKSVDEAFLVTVSKEYRYGENENGFGNKNFIDSENLFMSSMKLRSSCVPGPCSREERLRMYYSNSSVAAKAEDSPVVYTVVTELENNGTANGKTVYEFDKKTFIGDQFFTVPFSNRTYRNSKTWARGKLTKKTTYNSSGGIVSIEEKDYTLLKSQNGYVSQNIYKYIEGDWTGNGGMIAPCIPEYESFYVDGARYKVFNFQQSTGSYKEDQLIETIYPPDGGSPFVKTIDRTFESANLQLIQEEVTLSSNPEKLTTKYRYPFQLINTSSNYSGEPNALKSLTLANILNTPVENYKIISSASGSNPKVISAQYTAYGTFSGKTLPSAIYFLETVNPIVESSFQSSAATSSTVNRDSRYSNEISFLAYDSNGNLTQAKKQNGPSVTTIWGYNGAYPVASAVNASTGNISYTSFETQEKGGWSYSGSEIRVLLGLAKTGYSVYDLTGGAVSKSYTGASSGNPYKVSFWAKSKSGTKTVSVSGNSSASIGTSWTLVERTITSSSLSISGSGVLIDEIRMSPLNSQMKTYTFLPSVGMLSELDFRGEATFYQYDGLGRLETIVNSDGHVLKHYEYNFTNK